MKDPCVFCRIINDELSAAIVFEDDISRAFLDHRPLFPGHTLLVPRSHHETFTDLPPTQIRQFFSNAQLLANAVELAMEAEGTFVAMNNRVSQSVPHLHIHIVPRRRRDGLTGFFWPRNKYQDDEHIKKTQAAIKRAISGMT
jgi:histidine triad (HIT) family protein